MVRQESGVKDLGKVAELQQDGSPLQLGVSGQYRGKSFQIVGRIQLQYGDGFWNEWHLLYSSGETGWLGEAMGEYFVSFAKESSSPLPSQSKIAMGDRLTLDGESFVVTGSTQNKLSSYEGEIPFLVDSEASFVAYDLRSASGRAATIDYSDQPPTLFLGEYQPFQAFKFSGLRLEGETPDPGFGLRAPAATEAVDNFNCPTCGAPHSVEGGVASKVLVCEYCGSAVDISDSKLNVIWQEQKLRQELQGGTEIPLGSVARIGDLDYKLIGYVKKSVTYEGIKYPWVEYLLYHSTNGYRWLVESDGHFTLMETLDRVPLRADGSPVGRPNPEYLKLGDDEYRHFQTSTAVVDAVAGEFYWRVKLGEVAVNYDFVAPPRLLSMEATRQGFVWALGTYMTTDEVREMFGLDTPLREPVGVAPAQPNPYIEGSKSAWKTFWVCAIAGLLMLMTGVLSGSGKQVFRTKGEIYQAYRANPAKESDVFKLTGHGNVAFIFKAHPSQRWIYFQADLINQDTKKVYKAGATVERFHGKGSFEEKVRLSAVPSGNYKLRWELKSGTTSPSADSPDPKKKSSEVAYSITVQRGVPVWGWYFFMLVLLLPVPVLLTSRRSSFETRRWYNSDYG